jgi:hypothetical protein
VALVWSDFAAIAGSASGAILALVNGVVNAWLFLTR